MFTIYSSLDSAKNEFRILQLRSIAVSVTPNVQPSRTATLVDSNQGFQCTVCNTEASIQCNLYTACHGDRPQYEALSYTWGDEVSPNPITVNGVEVLVTENLLAALKRFRKEHSDVHLWVDALCINQLDSSVKAEQVKHMADIYRNAARTLIWLGPEYDDSHNTMAQLVKIGHRRIKLPDLLEAAVIGGDPNQIMTEFGNQFSEIFSQYLRDLPLALKFLKSIFSLWSRPYWSRAWIIQEFVVSPYLVIFCGRDETLYDVWQVASSAVLSLRDFLLRSITDSHDQQIKPGHRIYLGELRELNLTRTTKRALLHTRTAYRVDLDQRRSLFSAICSSQLPSKFNATDNRDLIFALLGLTSDTEDTKLSPDYDESTTCQEVYTSAARYMIY